MKYNDFKVNITLNYSPWSSLLVVLVELGFDLEFAEVQDNLVVENLSSTDSHPNVV